MDEPQRTLTASIAARAVLDVVAGADPVIAQAIRDELGRQRRELKLIASENYASPAVLFAMGNWLSDKYAEGTIGHRFYAGCEVVDVIEARAAQLACAVFGAPHAYVQPHSGIDANLVAFSAILAKEVEQPYLAQHGRSHVNELDARSWERLRVAYASQRMIGMSLEAGGHLTHGFRPNISGKQFEQRTYGTDPQTGFLDYDEVARVAREFRPLILIAGYSAYPRRVNFRVMREIADDVGATLMVDMAHFAGLVAGKTFTGEEDPVPFAHITTTTTHKSLRGPRGGMVLCQPEFAEFVDKGCPSVLGGPLPHVMAAKAVALGEASTPDFRRYSDDIVRNARALSEALVRLGVRLVTGGTDNHLVLLDVSSSYGLTGRQAEGALVEAAIVTNRNTIPGDQHGPWYCSGIRMGTPALTTLGMGPAEMEEVAHIVDATLRATQPWGGSLAKYKLASQTVNMVRSRVGDLLSRFPLYSDIQLSS